MQILKRQLKFLNFQTTFSQCYNASKFSLIMIWTLAKCSQLHPRRAHRCTSAKSFSTGEASPGKRNQRIISLLLCSPYLPSSQHDLQQSISQCSAAQRLALHWSSDPASCLNMSLILNSTDIKECMNGLWREAQGAAWRAKQSPASIAHSRKTYRADLAYTCLYLKEVTVAIPNAHPKVHKPNAVHPQANTSVFVAVHSGWKKNTAPTHQRSFLHWFLKEFLGPQIQL